MAFIVKKRVDLDAIGEDWHGAYLDFNSPTIGDVRKFADVKDEERGAAGLDAMASAFIGGKGWDGSKLIDIKKNQFNDLPSDVLEYANKIFTGGVSPNSPSD